jgi:hypothetical protein
MRDCLFRKALVVGIIFLFIGVGVQPAFAKNTIKTTISETLEDCECQTVSNHNFDRLEKLSIRIEKLLNRVKIFTNIVAILSKNNPEISKEKFEELSNRITRLKDINEKLDEPPQIICSALLITSLTLKGIGFYFGIQALEFEEAGMLLIANMLKTIGASIVMSSFIFDEIYIDIGCMNSQIL